MEEKNIVKFQLRMARKMFEKAQEKLVQIYGEDDSESNRLIFNFITIDVYYGTLNCVSSACSFIIINLPLKRAQRCQLQLTVSLLTNLAMLEKYFKMYQSKAFYQ